MKKNFPHRARVGSHKRDLRERIPNWLILQSIQLQSIWMQFSPFYYCWVRAICVKFGYTSWHFCPFLFSLGSHLALFCRAKKSIQITNRILEHTSSKLISRWCHNYSKYLTHPLHSGGWPNISTRRETRDSWRSSSLKGEDLLSKHD